MSELFLIKDIVLEYGKHSGVIYCFKENKLYKCIGGLKNYKTNNYIPKSYKKINYICLIANQESKDLAKILDIPVLHSRKIKRLKELKDGV
jgi:hypothetical protein